LIYLRNPSRSIADKNSQPSQIKKITGDMPTQSINPAMQPVATISQSIGFRLTISTVNHTANVAAAMIAAPAKAAITTRKATFALTAGLYPGGMTGQNKPCQVPATGFFPRNNPLSQIAVPSPAVALVESPG
jgi:hypothetical protein